VIEEQKRFKLKNRGGKEKEGGGKTGNNKENNEQKGDAPPPTGDAVTKEDTWAQKVRNTYLGVASSTEGSERNTYLGVASSTEGSESGAAPEDGEASAGPGTGTGSVHTAPKLTVKPFARMEASATLKKKTISEKWLEKELQKKQAEIDKHLKTRFKAMDVPRTTTVALYKQMQEAATQAREEAHKSRMAQLIESEKPFLGMVQREAERQAAAKAKKEKEESKSPKKAFVAKPPPAVISQATVSLTQRMEEEDRIRKERIAARAKELLASSSLPPRMAKWEVTDPNEKKSQVTKATGPEKPTWMPKVNTVIPNFAEKHEAWEKALHDARTQFRTTSSSEFSFLNAESDRAKEERKRLELREERKKRLEEKDLKANEKVHVAPKPFSKPPAMTKSTELKLKTTQSRLQERVEEKAEEEEERRVRESASAERPKSKPHATKPSAVTSVSPSKNKGKKGEITLANWRSELNDDFMAKVERELLADKSLEAKVKVKGGKRGRESEEDRAARLIVSEAETSPRLATKGDKWSSPGNISTEDDASGVTSPFLVNSSPMNRSKELHFDHYNEDTN
jgi:hypothetical protein